MSNVSDDRILGTFVRHVSYEVVRQTRALRSRPTHLTSRKTRVIQLRKTRVKYDTMSDFPILPLGTWVT